MASTYSTNLALELIGTGDQSGTWGTTTNTNLGTLIEQAISGYVTQAITDGADTTITIPNGATGVARNMYIEMTGALTATRNLIVPANKKLYFIYNNTTGGFAVTVKVSGQTGVSVPNGKKMVLVSNGTDVVEAVNAHGTLAVAGAATFGSTATFNSTTTFSNTASFTAGTITSSTPANDITQTWNSGGVTFTGWKMNITDSASASASLLADLQVAGSSKVSIRKDGRITSAGDLVVAAAAGAFTGITVGSGSTTNMGVIFGNRSSGNAAMWLTNVTPSSSNYTGYFDGSNILWQGWFKATDDGTVYVSGSTHEMRSSAADWVTQVTNKNASSPNGLVIRYTAAAPNGTGNNFLLGQDSGPTNRFLFPSNGGLYNYSANDSNLSDVRLKKNILPAPSYYEKFKAIQFRTYLYKDQTDSQLNLGVIAQELEQICPELVNNDGFGQEAPEDGVPLKSVYQTDFQYATAKALQELMLKFEELKTEFDAYKATHP